MTPSIAAGQTVAPAPQRVIRIPGGRPLRGEVTLGGAMNAALPALQAGVLAALLA